MTLVQSVRSRGTWPIRSVPPGYDLVEEEGAPGIIVSHTGRRDSYELAYALSLSGRTVHLVTDFYYQPGTIIGRISNFIFGKGIQKRHRSDLSVVVHSSPILFFTDLAERAFPRRKWNNMLRGWALGRRCVSTARRYGIREIYTYYNSGAHLLARQMSGLHITVFQMHPHPETLLRIYELYLARRPELRSLLMSQEEEIGASREYYSRLAEDALIADRVLCTSNFTRSTLLAAGVKGERIQVIPYGARSIAPVKAIGQDIQDHDDKGIRLAFVGQFVLRKGVYELLRVARSRPEVRLELFSRGAEEAQRLAEHWFGPLPKNILFRRIVDDGELWAAATKADFLILPSLAEGFGLVISEAMSHGLPVLATENTAAPDLLEDGHSGLLIDGLFEEDISNTIDRALACRAAWPIMRDTAREAVADRSWTTFREDLLKHLQKGELARHQAED